MGDPLSVASGTASLVVVALKSSREIWNYIEDLQSAPDHIKTTARALKLCRVTIDKVAAIINRSPHISNRDGYDEKHTLQEPIEEFIRTCNKLKQIVRPYHNGAGVPRRTLWTRIRWVYRWPRIGEIRRELEFHQGFLDSAFNILTLVTTQEMSERDQWRDIKLNRIEGIVDKRRRAETLSEDEETELRRRVQRHAEYRGSYASTSGPVSVPASVPDLPSSSSSPVNYTQYASIDAVVGGPSEQGLRGARQSYQVHSYSGFAAPSQRDRLSGSDVSQGISKPVKLDEEDMRPLRSSGPVDPYNRNHRSFQTQDQSSSRASQYSREERLLHSMRSDPGMQDAASHSIMSLPAAEATGQCPNTQQRRSKNRRTTTRADTSIEAPLPAPSAPVDPSRQQPEGRWMQIPTGGVTWCPYREPRPVADVKSAPSVMQPSVMEATRYMSEEQSRVWIRRYLGGLDVDTEKNYRRSSERIETRIVEEPVGSTGYAEGVNKRPQYYQSGPPPQEERRSRTSRSNMSVYRDAEQDFTDRLPARGVTDPAEAPRRSSHRRTDDNPLRERSTNRQRPKTALKEVFDPEDWERTREPQIYTSNERRERSPPIQMQPPWQTPQTSTRSALMNQDPWAGATKNPRSRRMMVR